MSLKATPHRFALIAVASASLLVTPAAFAGSFGGGAVTVNEGVLNSLGTGQAPVASNYGAYSAGAVAVAPTTAIGAPRGAGSSSVSPYQIFPTQEGSVVLPSYPLLFPPKSNPRSVAVAPQGSPAPARMSSPAQVPSSSSVRNQQQQPASQFIPPKPKVASTPAPAPMPSSTTSSTEMASSTPAPSATPTPVKKSSDSMTTASSSQPPKPVTLPAKPEVKKTMEEPVQTAAKTEMTAPKEDPSGNTASSSSASTPPPPPPTMETTSSDDSQMAKAPEPPAAPKMEAKVEPKVEPTSEPKAEMKPAEPVQTAAVNPTSTPVDDSFATLLFAPGNEDLTDDMKASLNKVIGDMKADSNLRIQLLSYAGGENLSVNQARRLSLKRALSVRRYLLDQDIRANRMDVRALGKAVDGGSLDRVDVKAARR